MLASNYAASVRSLIVAFVRDGILVRQSRPIDIQIASNNQGGYILAHTPGLRFRDEAFLKVEERFHIDPDGNTQRNRYAYHYERPGGYYIRFEREQHDGDTLYKPEYHLHVLWRLPHFPSVPMTLEATLNFIRTNFYSEHRQRLVGQTLAVQQI